MSHCSCSHFWVPFLFRLRVSFTAPRPSVFFVYSPTLSSNVLSCGVASFLASFWRRSTLPFLFLSTFQSILYARFGSTFAEGEERSYRCFQACVKIIRITSTICFHINPYMLDVVRYGTAIFVPDRLLPNNSSNYKSGYQQQLPKGKTSACGWPDIGKRRTSRSHLVTARKGSENAQLVSHYCRRLLFRRLASKGYKHELLALEGASGQVH